MTTIATWLVHCVLIAAVLAVAAHAWETSARWSGRSARWGWLAALGAAVVLPLALQLVPERVPGEAAVLPVIGAVMASAPAGPTVESAAPVDPVRWALAGWLLLSLAVAGYIAWSAAALRRARRGWRRAEVEGTEVCVARDTGPAAVGLRRPVVVLPAWALELEAGARSLLLLHEREHVRAGDPRMLVAALLLVAAMPWNPVLWYVLVRLRNALELDCDARVLRRGADPRAYGRLLLDVGRRCGRGAPVMATLGEPHLYLERRIRRIAVWPLRRRPYRAFALAAAAALFGAGALGAGEALRPVQYIVVDEPLDLPAGAATDGPALPALPRGPAVPAPLVSDTPPTRAPVFTPMTRRPVLRNAERVLQALREEYPRLLRDAGIGGTVTVWMFIDERGRPTRTMIAEPSGRTELDEAALKVAAIMEFEPARHGDQPTSVWVQVPIVFRPAGAADLPPEAQLPLLRTEEDVAARQRARRERQPVRRADSDDIAAAPTFTPMTQRPVLRNQQEVQRALVTRYPPLLRDAGIGGEAIVWVFIDTDGVVRRSQLSISSGRPELDLAAVEVAEEMRFTPARNRDAVVPVWLEVPIVFAAR